MGLFFSALLAKFVGLASWVLALTVGILAVMWLFSTDLGAWVFEQVLDVAIAALNAIDFDSQTFNPGTYIAALPSEVTNMLGLLRVGEALAIILAAITVRITLQLVPFTRLGS